MVAILPARSYRRMPWKNGGGTTLEIAAEAQLDPGWRLSIATIARGGPFSIFENCDRTIVAIDGDGVALTVADGGGKTLDRPGALWRFDGAREVTCSLLRGPVRDFNVMTRRGRYDHEVMLCSVGSSAVDLTCADLQFVLVLHGALLVELADGEVRCGFEGDTVSADPHERCSVRAAREPTEICRVVVRALS